MEREFIAGSCFAAGELLEILEQFAGAQNLRVSSACHHYSSQQDHTTILGDHQSIIDTYRAFISKNMEEEGVTHLEQINSLGYLKESKLLHVSPYLSKGPILSFLESFSNNGPSLPQKREG